MKKVFKNAWLIPLFICAFMSCFALTSCSDDPKYEPNNPNNPNNPSDTSKEHPFTSKLKGTSWHIDRYTEYGETKERGNAVTDIYFTDQPYNDDVYPLNDKNGRYFIGYVNLSTEWESSMGTNKIAWRIETARNGEAFLESHLLKDNQNIRAKYEDFSWFYGTSGYVLMLSASSLVVGSGDDNYRRAYFTPSEWRGGSGFGDGGGSSNDYEKPDIGLESYDCYTNSIIAHYRIYNQDEAKVTSAKGYYGTSSASKSVNAIVGGSRITVKFYGLKANTTYYIKCTATGKGGSGSSETTRLSTTD